MKIVLLKEFLSQYESRETRRAYLKDIQGFFKNSKKGPDKITRVDALNYMNGLIKKVMPATVARKIYGVKSYFKFLISMDILVKNPFDGLRLPKKHHKYDEGITDDEAILLMENSTGMNRVVILLMLFNGLRRSEVCGLLRDKIYKIDNDVVIEIIGKGNKQRVMPLHRRCQKAISDYLSENSKKTKILITRNGKKITGNDVYAIVTLVAKKSGIKRRIYPHLLRAKFASMALESGVPITSVQADLGHSSIETTAIYDKSKTMIKRSSVQLIDLVKKEKK